MIYRFLLNPLTPVLSSPIDGLTGTSRSHLSNQGVPMFWEALQAQGLTPLRLLGTRLLA